MKTRIGIAGLSTFLWSLLLLHPTTLVAADHGDPVVGTGAPIPGTTMKIAEVTMAYADAGRVIFEAIADDGSEGFGILSRPTGQEYQFDAWVDASPLLLMRKTSPSEERLAFIAFNAQGLEGIFGVADVGDPGVPQQILLVGDTLPGQPPPHDFQIAGFSDLELVGTTLVANIKKANAGQPAGDGLYSLPNFPSTTGMELIVGTGQMIALGYISTIEDFSHDGKKAIVSLDADLGSGVFVTENLSETSQLTLLADTSTAIPFSTQTFSGFGHVQLRKKATFEGHNGTISGIYYTETPGSGDLSRIADTNMDVPDLVGKKFTNFDGISVDGKRFLFVANTSDGSRSIFSGLENVGKISKKRELWNGMNVGGKILETFEFGRKSLGSVVVAGQYDDGSSGVVAAEFSFLAVPAISHIGMIILVLVAIVAVTISVRHESA